ncbi:TATA-binding transcription initiation factor [Natronomonas moolapensis 8.8.11]|uniref:TATA-binding transcription initiation factor n=1 Tax=Natronomonas moolapensis (strain DSM 18674 / CECT 7526 / JCM 14361 / 8.8.11) TaxID=268739 RepID=M1XNH7_NATM8|nr:TATA-binding transcription initiation factor [Natronomonas moolapensis]CCQ35484.1 TATA-binding transcription initiation factor [Natronomonas moolapensis 8.8.11]
MAGFEIANVAGTITYQQELDLSALAETFRQRPEINSVTYEPDENHWLQVWFAPNDTYVSFYRSGKCSIVGATSPKQFDELVERVNALMRELLEFDYEPTAKINNIVATAELDSLASLETIAIGLGLEQTEYEPEQFPALIHRYKGSVLLVFSSGKIVCTGAAEMKQVSSVIDDITEQIEAITIE